MGILDAPAGLRSRGAWAAATNYAKNDIVTYNGGVYRATAAFTSAASFNPANWEQWAPQSGTSATAAQIKTLRRGLRPATTRPNTGLLGVAAAASTVGLGGANMAKGFAWRAPDSCNVVGVVVSLASGGFGNWEVAVYDEHFTKLGGTGMVSTPATGDNLSVSFPTGVPVIEGRKYYIIIWSSAGPTFRGSSWYNTGDDSGILRFTAAFGVGTGLPAQLNPKNYAGDGVTYIFSQSSGQVPMPSVVVLMEPVLRNKIASDLTVQNATAVIGVDRTNNRLFATSSSGSVLRTSTDNGATTTVADTFTGETLLAAVAAGSYVFISSMVNADSTGIIRRFARNGPFTAAAATVVLTGQEGYSRPWNLKAYDDGLVFAGNYETPYGGVNVRLRRSADWGGTWTIPIDLGVARTDTVTAMTTGATTITDATATSADVGKTIYDGVQAVAANRIGVVGSVSGGAITLANSGTVPSLANGHTTITLSFADHFHAVLRSTIDPTKMYANIGDQSSKSGWYVSTDTGVTWTLKTAFGAIRTLEMVETADGKIVAAGDDYSILMGNLAVYDPVADTLRPHSIVDAPWYEDVYALSRDPSTGYIWYITRGTGRDTGRRSAVWCSPDDGQTSYLIDDLGIGPDGSLCCPTMNGYLFLGNAKRYPISGATFT